jgi:hypothetical protein
LTEGEGNYFLARTAGVIAASGIPMVPQLPELRS